MDESNQSQILLILSFLAVIFGAPAYQTIVEIRRQHPVQVTDLFRETPSVKNLRRFEQELEDNWWGQTSVRPMMQRALFVALHDTGHKAIEGRRGWFFYRPAVQYLTRVDRQETAPSSSRSAASGTGRTQRDSVVQAIVKYRDQLQERGLELLVVPVPSKASVYPDLLTRRFAEDPNRLRSPTEELLEELDRHGVHAVNLFQAFRRARQDSSTSESDANTNPHTDKEYFLARDTHWTPQGARIAAQAVAHYVRDHHWTTKFPLPYTTQTADVGRYGDLLEMIGIPRDSHLDSLEPVRCERVLDPLVGPMVPPPGGRDGRFKNDHLLDTPMEPTVLLLGDSFCRIYQSAEPASLGTLIASEAAEAPDAAESSARQNATTSRTVAATARLKRSLLPGSAGFPSLLAYELKAGVDYIISDGGAATDVRQRLSVDAEILDNKRLIVWEFTERDIRYGKAGWEDVPLPPEL